MVNGPVPNSRYGQRPPQAGYVSESVSPHEPMPANSLQYGRPGRGECQRALPRGGDYRASGQARYGQGARSMRDVRYPSREDRPVNSRYSGSTPSAGRPRPQGSMPGWLWLSLQFRACRSAGGNSISAVSRQISEPSSPFSDNRVLLMLGAAAIIILLLLLLLIFRGCAPSSDVQLRVVRKLHRLNRPQLRPIRMIRTMTMKMPWMTATTMLLRPRPRTVRLPPSPIRQTSRASLLRPRLRSASPRARHRGSRFGLDGKSVYGDTVVGPF